MYRALGRRASRLLTTGFIGVHLAALIAWNLPECALKRAIVPWALYYMLPTGLWQHWGMFAPNPVRDSVAFEAIVQDRHGMLRSVAFPRLVDLPVHEGALKYRHGKFTAMVGQQESGAAREFVARHVARTSGIEPADYPVTVQLLYQVWPSNPPGGGEVDRMARGPLPHVLGTYYFPNEREALP
jgi:hypothetical protein